MYAIVETSGKQFRVVAGDRILVDRRKEEVGTTVVLDRVLFVHSNIQTTPSEGGVRIGDPTVAGATVTCRVVEHPRGEKLKSFKYVRTRQYRRRHGYRHAHTLLEVTAIQG